jgi:hypothetical protein
MQKNEMKNNHEFVIELKNTFYGVHETSFD